MGRIRGATEAHVDAVFSRSWFDRYELFKKATLATEQVVYCGLSDMG